MKKIVSLLLSLLLVLSFSTPAFAAHELSPRATHLAPPSVAAPNAEQTTWIYRVNNGYIEMRLWSITQSKWLTEWIVVGPVNP